MFTNMGFHAKCISAQSPSLFSKAATHVLALTLFFVASLPTANAATFEFNYPFGIARNSLQEAEQDLNYAAVSDKFLDSGERAELMHTWTATVGTETRRHYHYRYLRRTGEVYNGPFYTGSAAACSSWPAPSYSDAMRGSPGSYSFAFSIVTAPQAGYDLFTTCWAYGIMHYGRTQMVDYPPNHTHDTTTFGLPTYSWIITELNPDFSGPKNNGCPVSCSANPVNNATGNKYQAETDYAAGNGIPAVRRYYNSSTPGVNDSFGVGWSADILKRLELTSTTLIQVHQASGRSERAKVESGVRPPADKS